LKQKATANENSGKGELQNICVENEGSGKFKIVETNKTKIWSIKLG